MTPPALKKVVPSLRERLLSKAKRAAHHRQKQLDKRKKLESMTERTLQLYQLRAKQKTVNEYYRTEKRNREEDWALGPRLMPRRDIGGNEKVFGTISQDAAYNPPKPENRRRRPMFAAGDRVAIMTGIDKGKIGPIKEVNDDSETLVVQGMNRASFVPPDWLAEENGFEPSKPVAQEVALPWDDVRLVVKVMDMEGKYKDVVVENLQVGPPEPRKVGTPFTGRKLLGEGWLKGYERWIPSPYDGLRMRIPWPEEEASKDNEDEEERLDRDLGTLRIERDKITWRAELRKPPMPPSVLDELRGKYSKHRTRHDPEWLREKEAIEAARQQKLEKVRLRAMTPMEQRSAEYKETKKPIPDLSETQLDAIGRVIAREKGLGDTTSSASNDFAQESQ